MLNSIPEVGKYYRDEDGNKVLILFDSGENSSTCPLLAVVLRSDGSMSRWYRHDGTASGTSVSLTGEWKDPDYRYINLYPKGVLDPIVYPTKLLADENRDPQLDRLACIKVDLVTGEVENESIAP